MLENARIYASLKHGMNEKDEIMLSQKDRKNQT